MAGPDRTHNILLSDSGGGSGLGWPGWGSARGGTLRFAVVEGGGIRHFGCRGKQETIDQSGEGTFIPVGTVVS